MIELGTTKYIIHAELTANGYVEKHDIIGAIFGQTEGLLGSDLDLRDLQKSGRIGRIDVELNNSNGKSYAKIVLPSSLDKVETAILAATLETIDRVGPCLATVKVVNVEDIRIKKRQYITSRAKELLKSLVDSTIDTYEITEEIKEYVRTEEIIEYGDDKLPSGPNIDNSDAIIVVEGRADVINLLRCGIKNAIAVEGTSIPPIILELSKKKTTTIFTDGDRGGELILKEALQTCDIDYVARAPHGREVEELSKKEIIKCLRSKIPVEQYVQLNINRCANDIMASSNCKLNSTSNVINNQCYNMNECISTGECCKNGHDNSHNYDNGNPDNLNNNNINAEYINTNPINTNVDNINCNSFNNIKYSTGELNNGKMDKYVTNDASDTSNDGNNVPKSNNNKNISIVDNLMNISDDTKNSNTPYSNSYFNGNTNNVKNTNTYIIEKNSISLNANKETENIVKIEGGYVYNNNSHGNTRDKKIHNIQNIFENEDYIAQMEYITSSMEEISGTGKIKIVSKEHEEIRYFEDLEKYMSGDIKFIISDIPISQRMIDIFYEKTNNPIIVGRDIRITKKPSSLKILTYDNLKNYLMNKK